jgi:glycosyltransferase involved in cell wall biosynthesis
MPGPRFLFAGTEVPSLGGSSTALYDLYQRFLEDGHDVHLINILEQQDAAFFKYTFDDRLGNPRGLQNVANCWLAGDALAPQPLLRTFVDALDPDVGVGFGYYASLLLARADRGRPNVLVTGNCAQASDYVTSGRARDAIGLGRDLAARAIPPRLIHYGEPAAMARASLVVAHSPQTLAMIERFYPSSVGKLYPEVIPFAEWIRDGALRWVDRARPFERRDIDVLFIASNWQRPVKNYELAAAIIKKLPDLSVHIVGDVTRVVPGATHYGFVASRETLFELLGRTKCVACPSLIDAAPGILVEASTLGCNVVASKNCGNWELCHPDLLVDPYGLDGFVTAIRHAMQRKFDDSLDDLLACNGYAHFAGLLHAFAQPFREPVC